MCARRTANTMANEPNMTNENIDMANVATEPISVDGSMQQMEQQDEMSDEDQVYMRDNEVAFSWEAAEYVQHHKSVAWYVMLVGVVVVLIGFAVWLHYWLEIGAFLTMGVALLVYSNRAPRVLRYELTPTGVTVDGRSIPYSEFRSFAVIQDDDWHSIDLEPIKRFSMRLNILFNPQDFDIIVDHLELHLSRIDHKPDLIDRISRILRF
jgi:hypothetical protein